MLCLFVVKKKGSAYYNHLRTQADKIVTTSNDRRYARGRKGSPEGFGISISGLRCCSDISLPLRTHWSKLDLWTTQASLAAQLVKNLPAVQETWVQFLGQEDPGSLFSQKRYIQKTDLALGDNVQHFTTQSLPSSVYMQRILHTMIFINAIFQSDCTKLYFHLHKKFCGCITFPTLSIVKFQDFFFCQLDGHKMVFHCDLNLYFLDH